MVRQGGPQGCVLRRLTCRNNNDATGSITFGSTDGPMTMRQWCQPRARHPIGGSANRSLSHIEPVSGTPKRKLQNGEERCSSRFTREVVKIALEKGRDRWTTDARGHDGGGNRHSSSDRQHLTGRRSSGADPHHEEDHKDRGRGWNQAARPQPEGKAPVAGDRAGGARQRFDRSGQVEVALWPVVGCNEPGGGTGKALLRGARSGVSRTR